MQDNVLPKSVGKEIITPFQFQEQEELCRRLDWFYFVVGKRAEILPSNRFLGALYLMSPDHRNNNPDWMAQVAHSLREILYPFDGGGQREKAFSDYGSVYSKKSRDSKVGEYTSFIRSVAHHNFTEASRNGLIGGTKTNPIDITEEVFEKVFTGFGNIMFEVLRQQTHAHQEIDALLAMQPIGANTDTVWRLVNLNVDARDYFFAKADGRWLAWLWENHFLDAIKERVADQAQYSYSMPELGYVVAMAEEKPKEVADITLSFSISEDNFNPEVIDQLLHGIEKFPATELARVVPKIHEENWVRLMGGFNRWGYQYEKMLDTLSKAGDFESMLLLSEVILTVQEKKDKQSNDRRERSFYLGNLAETGVFKCLADVDESHIETALQITAEALGKVVTAGRRQTGDQSIFSFDETFYLFDTDFFSLEVDEKDRVSSDRDNVHELAAVVVTLLRKASGAQPEAVSVFHDMYERYIEKLPDTRAMWRLQLFALSLMPEAFKDKIKEKLFRIFETEEYHHELVSGTEYERLIQTGFSVLDEADQRDYVKKALELFGTEDMRVFGKDIFTCLKPSLASEEKELAEKTFGLLPDNYIPQPSISHSFGGTIKSRAPEDETVWERPISEIVEKLKTDWSPAKLEESYRDREYLDEYSFLHPIDANGTGERIKNEMKRRTNDYLEQAELFFDRERLHPHYTYIFLEGVRDLLREKVVIAVNSEHLLSLIRNIIESGLEKPFEKPEKDRGMVWLADWRAVFSALTELIQSLFTEESGKAWIEFSAHRNELFDFVQALLRHSDPSIQSENKQYIPEKEGYSGIEPYGVAINSVRGKAFVAFLNFLYRDGERLKALGAERKIEDDSKKLFEDVLKSEQTQAMAFLFGRNLASLYYRDTPWTQSLLPSIFPDDSKRREFALAAWEGYLSNNLYEEVFFDSAIQDLYQQAIQRSLDSYPKRRYFRNLDEGLATHLALAYVHYVDVTLDSDLITQFLSTENTKRHKEFFSFIGRYCISRDSDSKFSDKEPLNTEKLKQLWNWAIRHCKPKVLDGFGSWINPNRNIFEDDTWLAGMVSRTLEKSKGGTNWEYGLKQILPIFACEAPQETLSILRAYLFGRRNEERSWFYVDDNLLETFRTLAKNTEVSQETRKLINELIYQYGRRFWPLKEVLPKLGQAIFGIEI